MRRALAIVVLAGGLVALVAGCGGSSSSSDPTTTTASAANYSGATANPPKPAPALQLSNYNGKPVNIDQYKGKAVLVTFIYDHCPDICPLIVSNLHAAQNQMSAAERKQLQIIAVSVDPKGDTPQTVKKFLADHQMTGRMDYLIGSRPQLENVWADWNIKQKNDPSNKNPDAVEHSALIYGISGTGDITTLYPANFKPDQIVHDVPKLASS
ncbi:MAG TPA: SCO family protein [Solirubrobacterales bacterium]|nr:SCO family protein [Solirubrobacterales bacterium]